MTAISRHNNFNLLRLIAAFLVVVSHSYGILDKALLQPMLQMQEGQLIPSDLGLYIFFTISGYLVYKSLVASPSYLHYLWRRFIRIVPGLAVVNLACIILGLLVTILPASQYLASGETWQYLIINTSLIANHYHLPGVFTTLENKSINASLWTILLEVKFYIALLLGQMIGITKNRWLILICFVAMQICRLYFSIYKASIPSMLPDVYFTFGSYFFMGVLYAYFPQLLNVKWFLPLTLLTVALFLNTPFNNILISLSLPYFILKAGQSKPLLGLHKADYSYGLYLYAFPVQQMVLLTMGKEIPVIVHIVISTAIALMFASLSWHNIEKPALQKKDALPALIKRRSSIHPDESPAAQTQNQTV
ncbi:MAG TPA: acyltransferase [Flavisolibacter sp.]|nr:acyltransferase [Flavisolibacter sp.]